MSVYLVVAVVVTVVALAVLMLRALARSKDAGAARSFPTAWAGPLPSPAPGAPRVRLAPDAISAVHQAARENGLALEQIVLIASVAPTGGYKLDIYMRGDFDPASYVRTTGSGTEAPPVLVPRELAGRFDGLVIEHAPGGFIFGGALLAVASDPGRLSLSHAKLAVLEQEMAAEFGTPESTAAENVDAVAFQLMNGDSRAAVVVTTEPELLVAAFTDELACVVPLRFPRTFVSRFNLAPGSRLLTVNSYRPGTELARDLTPGPGAEDRYVNFAPMIADFLTDDADRLRERKAEIGQSEWQRAEAMAAEYVRRQPGRARDGRPALSAVPA